MNRNAVCAAAEMERRGVIEIALAGGVRVDEVGEAALRRVLGRRRHDCAGSGVRVYLATQPCDIRRGPDGLAAQVQNVLAAVGLLQILLNHPTAALQTTTTSHLISKDRPENPLWHLPRFASKPR
ncbi:hypothetical protein [Mesorhizobium sp. ISC15]|uniref:hypothetical protein n=1 Tax=Mesorhizobium sp. ISC15 TaxID=3076429 RepID=UPI00301CE374